MGKVAQTDRIGGLRREGSPKTQLQSSSREIFATEYKFSSKIKVLAQKLP
jgi:hypothetical protein